MAESSGYFNRGGETGAAVKVRRVGYFVMLLWLTIFYLFIDFRGLSVPEGMDQAQIAREIARGNGFETKTIRPLALYQINRGKELKDELVPLAGFQDTYHAPLNPLLNSLFLKMFQSKWEFDRNANIYFLDRIVALVSTLLFLSSIGVSYLLLARIFDARIAGVAALLMLLSEFFWDYARSGLPQMLMLFLFMFALYFLYQALESAQASRSPLLWLGLCGGFMGLLTLTHWMTVWLFLGLVVYVAFSFRPRGLTAFLVIGVFAIIVLPWFIRNVSVSGSPLGSGIYGLYNGLAGGTEGVVMRNFDPENDPLPTDGMPTKLIISSLRQLEKLHLLLGGIVVAPMFFLSLLHPFRRPEIASFRWAVFLMWLPAVLAMSIFGLTSLFGHERAVLDSNQLHLLFVPLMTGYGLAFLSVLWTRLGLPAHYPMVRNGHFILVIILSAAPLLLTTPQRISRGVRTKGLPHWPPYIPAGITRLGDWTEENEIIVSDVPWAVAWYADRMSMWLPSTQDQFEDLGTYGKQRGTPFAGVFLTPMTTNARLGTQIMRGEYGEWARLILRGEMFKFQVDVIDPDFAFPFATPMPTSNQSFFYSDSRRWLKNPEEAEN